MTFNNQKMPDLMHGSITIGLNSDSGNAWKTYIEAALIADDEKAFLATNCRAEHVREKGDLIGRRFSEVSVISTSNKDWIIRSGTGIWHPFRRRISEKLHYGEIFGGTNVYCPEVDVRTLTFEELYEDVSNADRDNNIYMRVTYIYDGRNFEIFCPCRYINYANSPRQTAEKKKYVQPISGYVLFKHNQRYHQAYIVAYVDNNGTRNCEVVLRVPEYIMNLKRKVGGVSISILNKIFGPFRNMLLTDEFSYIIKLDAEVSFFRYLR